MNSTWPRCGHGVLNICHAYMADILQPQGLCVNYTQVKEFAHLFDFSCLHVKTLNSLCREDTCTQVMNHNSAIVFISCIIVHSTKLLASDWSRGVQL